MSTVNKLPVVQFNDSAGMEWSNDVLKPLLDAYADEINAISVSREPKVQSDNRAEQLKLEGGVYYIGTDGIALGYPANYLTLINMKRDANLNLQLLYSNVGIWARTVSHNNSSLDWTPMAHPTLSRSLTQGSGVSSLARNVIYKTGNVVYLEVAGTFTTGTGNKVIGVLPADVVPSRALRFIGVALTTASAYGAQQFIINQGTREIIAEGIPTTAQGGAFQLNITYTI